MLRLPAPIGSETKHARRTPPQRAVVDWKAPYRYAVDFDAFFGKCLEAGQPEGFQIVGDGSKDSGAMPLDDQISGESEQGVFIPAAIGKESGKHEDDVHRHALPLVGSDHLHVHQVIELGDGFVRRTVDQNRAVINHNGALAMPPDIVHVVSHQNDGFA